MSTRSNSHSSSRGGKPDTGDLREKLKHADMSLFDRFMRKVVRVPKEEADKRQAEIARKRARTH